MFIHAPHQRHIIYSGTLAPNTEQSIQTVASKKSNKSPRTKGNPFSTEDVCISYWKKKCSREKNSPLVAILIAPLIV